MNFTRHLLLAKDIGNVISSERTRGVCFGESAGNRFGAVFTDEREQFADLSRQGAVGIREPARDTRTTPGQAG